jgi:hypoxanthine phosphoribosyltransferase
VLVSAEQLAAKVRSLGARIRRDYAGREIVLVGVLKGAFIFMADLARAIELPVTCDFLRVSSYRGTESTGSVRFEFDLTQSIEGKHVILVEDIVDTGITAAAVLAQLQAKQPASLALCALMRKPSREKVAVPIDYLGFTIPDQFVVGYGLDYDGRYRNLPYLGVLKS